MFFYHFFYSQAMTQMFIVLLAIEREIVNLTFEGKQTLEEFATILLNLFLVEYESNFLLFNILAAFTQITKKKIKNSIFERTSKNCHIICVHQRKLFWCCLMSVPGEMCKECKIVLPTITVQRR